MTAEEKVKLMELIVYSGISFSDDDIPELLKCIDESVLNHPEEKVTSIKKEESISFEGKEVKEIAEQYLGKTVHIKDFLHIVGYNEKLDSIILSINGAGWKTLNDFDKIKEEYRGLSYSYVSSKYFKDIVLQKE